MGAEALEAGRSAQKAFGKDSTEEVLQYAANELIFAVVGHAGAGTSTVAESLRELLIQDEYDVQVIKARAVIGAWAEQRGTQLPSNAVSLSNVEKWQDLGDGMREQTKDCSSVGRGMVAEVRRARANKLGQDPAVDGPVRPDGHRRAYVLDSIRHPAEVEILRHVYQDAFILVGVVCEEERRLNRLTTKYADAGRENAKKFMKRDAKAGPTHGQRVADAFHMADFFIDNSVERLDDGSPNKHWDINDKLSRLIKMLRQESVVRPESSETAMHHAAAASMRSACLSRQVGASLVDSEGSIVATGTNEVPRAGGGVYGEGFDEDREDNRCAFRSLPNGEVHYCSSNREQIALVNKLILEIPELNELGTMRKLALSQEIRKSGIGDLLEFSRAIHAEMDALLSAGRSGKNTVGGRLFVTTFPCHYCARHIVSSGVDEVQYIEPYPKSRAFSLHGDAVTQEAVNWMPPSRGGTKVLFRPFVGVAPRLYRRVFVKNRDLKDGNGNMSVGTPVWGSSLHLRASSYVDLEAALAKMV
jgi:deoxycytidylate deaminase